MISRNNNSLVIGQESLDEVTVKDMLEGDTFQQPAEAVHRDANPGDEPSLIFVTMHGPLDFHPHK